MIRSKTSTKEYRAPPDTALAYAAGIIDGEGCISFSVHRPKDRPSAKYRLGLSVQMVHLPTLHRLSVILGDRVRPIHRGRSKGNRRDIWRWEVTSHPARRVITSLLPYLVTKLPEAHIGLRYYQIMLPVPSRRGRPQEHTETLNALVTELKAAKRYEWIHSVKHAK